MSLHGLPAIHLKALLDGSPVFDRYGLLLAGGYAFRAHKLLYRPSQDLDFATGDATPLPEIAEHVRQAFQSAGYAARLIEATSRYARLVLQFRRWVLGWYDDLAHRLVVERMDDDLPDDL